MQEEQLNLELSKILKIEITPKEGEKYSNNIMGDNRSPTPPRRRNLGDFV